MDQIDFTRPFEVLSRISNSTIHAIAKTNSPIRDIQGLLLTPEMSISEAPEFDVLLVPGGYGQQQLMNLLPYYGATPIRSRVVVDGNLVTAAGVTAVLDAGARPQVAELRKFHLVLLG
jgi:cyclohexyl-isocyanide hydratase